MAGPYAAGRKALGICDRCGFTYRLLELRKETVNRILTDTKVCPACFDTDHPQLGLGRLRINDPQALLDPRTDSGEEASKYGTSIRFEFDTDEEDFVGTNCTFLNTGNKSALLTATSNDPQIEREEGTSSAISVDASIYTQVTMLFRTIVSGTWSGELWWQRTTEASWSTDRRLIIPYSHVPNMGSADTVVKWDLFGVANWDGTVDGVRIFPYEESGTSIEIDYIRFESRF